MYRPLVVSLAAFVLVSVPRFVGAQDSCDKEFVVSEVSLSTTTRLPASEQAAIRASLIGRCFDNQQLDELGGGVRDVLQSLGYLRAAVPEPSITAAPDTSRHPEPVSLNVEVKEGAHYKVREIEVIGSTAISQAQFIALSQIQLEDFFDRNKMRETAEAVRKLYTAHGYLNASVAPEVQILGPSGVCVRFKVVEGLQSP